MIGYKAFLARITVIFVFCAYHIHAGGIRWNEMEHTVVAASLKENVVVEYNFVNDSDTAVSIVSIVPSCDCLSVKANKISYAPGERGSIRAEFPVSGRSGVHTKTIAVTADGAANSPVTLNLVIKLPEPLVVTPRLLFWRVGEDLIEKEFIVRIEKSASGHIREVQCADPGFNVRLAVAGERDCYRVIVAPRTTAKPTQATIRMNAVFDGRLQVFVVNASVK